MSHLTLATNWKSWQMNVLSFNSPVYGTITSVQTKKMAMHFPIRSTQPEVSFNVIFSSERDYEDFQRFVRAHQQKVLDSPSTGNVITLNWPQRGITNWTGVIKKFRAGGQRRNHAPIAQFSVDLIDSMVSARTDISSLAPNWQTIFGQGMGPNAVLGLPTPAENALAQAMYGQNLGPSSAAPASSSSAPSDSSQVFPAPTSLPNGGILRGGA